MQSPKILYFFLAKSETYRLREGTTYVVSFCAETCWLSDVDPKFLAEHPCKPSMFDGLYHPFMVNLGMVYILAFYLTYVLAFYLASILTFYLAVFLAIYLAFYLAIWSFAACLGQKAFAEICWDCAAKSRRIGGAGSKCSSL